MPDPEIVLTETADDRLDALINDGLNAFNDTVIGYSDRRPLSVVVRDPGTGEILGGAKGRTSLGLLFVELFWLPEALRGSGLGSRILRMMEEEGRRRGCRSAVLFTISFQAPDFYRRHGWRVFGDIPCDPPGTSRVFMTKDLA
ncbi:GNAT family N-acetyltransferase [Mycobacterium sp. KBS0706]|uniref:GNAT family N-acetyltransferase n=1 Tax=Mycobacterium sp. KBS0706 TaxID=2578109 RepID=UPI00110FDD9F|nr:GNAT family N-acetyltransferase [Mycobacterium sp. KBS0706]TSD86950.1 GNAT family N-acetyltransferase [Mycobacterium sp. KBS0706]